LVRVEHHRLGTLGFSPGGQYGKTLWFKGKVDSLGNFKLNEYYPENQLMGILDGKFSQDYRQMSGYFSKPDGSGLEPFELEETDPPGLGIAPECHLALRNINRRMEDVRQRQIPILLFLSS